MCKNVVRVCVYVSEITKFYAAIGMQIFEFQLFDSFLEMLLRIICFCSHQHQLSSGILGRSTHASMQIDAKIRCNLLIFSPSTSLWILRKKREGKNAKSSQEISFSRQTRQHDCSHPKHQSSSADQAASERLVNSPAYTRMKYSQSNQRKAAYKLHKHLKKLIFILKIPRFPSSSSALFVPHRIFTRCERKMMNYDYVTEAQTQNNNFFSLFHNSWRRRRHPRAVPGRSSSFCIFALDKFFCFSEHTELETFFCVLALTLDAKGRGRREAATTTSDNDKHVKKREKMWQGGRKMWGKHSHIAIVVFGGECMVYGGNWDANNVPKEKFKL